MSANFLHPAPNTWPGPDPARPRKLVSRVDPNDLVDLYNRRITTRAFARKYAVSEKWVGKTFPGKRPIEDKRTRRTMRDKLRELQATLVRDGLTSLPEAADRACCSYSCMRRLVLKVSGAETLEALWSRRSPAPARDVLKAAWAEPDEQRTLSAENARLEHPTQQPRSTP